jgi:hypothetical protein
METKTIILTIAVIVLVSFFFSIGLYRKEIIENIFRDKNLLKKGMDLPVIWLYYDTSDVNSRWWADFGQRSTRVINVPYLNLCYESIVEANKGIYRVEVISGLSDAAARLGGWHQLPKFMRNPLASVGPAEMNWLRAEFLSRFGGLWVSPSIICLKPFHVLEPGTLTFYGTDMDESYSGRNGTTVPGFAVMGCLVPGDERLKKWAEASYARLEEGGGGKQIRGDAKWDYVAFASGKTAVYSREEISRKSDGRRIQLEDLLAAGQDGALPFDIPREGIYVLVPWEEMKDRRNFGWFLRMNEDQILDSDLAISEIFRNVV